jgi:hypothetical protein
MISIARRSLVEIYRLYRGTCFLGLQSTTEDGKLIAKCVLKKWDARLFSGEQFYVKQSLEFSFFSSPVSLSTLFVWCFSNIHSFIILSFILLSVLRQVHSFFLSEFSTECDLLRPLSFSSMLSFPYGHPAAAYVFFLVFPSFLPCIFPSVTFS